LFHLGVLGGCYWGLGVGSGVLISGLLINWVGVAKTYLIFSMTSILVLVLFLCTHLFVKLRKGKKEIHESYELVATGEEESKK